MEQVGDLLGKWRNRHPSQALTICDPPEASKRSLILRDLRIPEKGVKTFAGLEKVEGLDEALVAFQALANGHGKPMLLCFGSSGCGKTHLLRALVLRLNGRGIYCRYLEWYKIIQTLKSGLDKGAIPSYEDVLENYRKAPALTIDDYGLGTGNTDWEKSQLEIMVDYRWDRQLITVITTNLQHDQLPDRVISRFRDADVGVIVVNRAEDYRRTRREDGEGSKS